MSIHLVRITTGYSEAEDRLCLTGERADGAPPLVIWLTRRLCRLLLPVTLRWLGQQLPGSVQPELLHEFAQQAAQSGLAPQPQVRPDGESESWLAAAIDLALGPELHLTFRTADGAAALLVLTPEAARQWLGILQTFDANARWLDDLWPDWMSRGGAAALPSSVVLH